MLFEEFEKQVSFNVDVKIYELANTLYMTDNWSNNIDFCKNLDTLVYEIERNEDIRLQNCLDNFIDSLSTITDPNIHAFLVALFGLGKVIYAKCKHRIRLTDAELFYLENLLKVTAYETEENS